MQSVLNPVGPDAAIIAEISWVLFIGSAVIFVAVMALAVASLAGRLRLPENLLIVGGGIVFPVVTLSALFVYSLVRAGALYPGDAPALRIEVTGEQWWWRVRYPGFETANEIRIPVGQPVELVLRSADVVHSFWVPVLAGKLDMVPGKENRLRLRADRPGQFRGQCAEYCGGPHAQMALFVVALEPEAYERWADRQREPAREENPLFVSHCAACHTVRGTAASGTLGPDLTHVGSRLSIGAGILPNNAGTIGSWIASSQHIKPGNLMPAFEHFSGEQLRELAAYVETLK
ncbi:MAG TPA: cytochrome c oxidase subunit II [Burkholderiales bacterium]|nr:cytochrome c oxidase subunit II [Burkholderiales bacterium]